MCYNTSLVTTDAGMFFKFVPILFCYCKTYSLVEHTDLGGDGEIFLFQKKLPNGKIKGVQASRLKQNKGYTAYIVKFNFFEKEV